MPAMRFPTLAEEHRGHVPLLLQIGPHQRDGGIDAGPALFGRRRGMREFLAQVAFQDFGHQSVDRTAHRRELLQDRRAVGTLLQRALQRIQLAADALDARERFLLVGGRMRHGDGSL